MSRWLGEDLPLGERPSTRPRLLDLYTPGHWNLPEPEPDSHVRQLVSELRQWEDGAAAGPMLRAFSEPVVPTAWAESAHGFSVALCSCSVTGWGGCPVREHYEQGQMREARLRASLYAKARQDVRWAAFGSVATMAGLAGLLIWAGQAGGAW